MKARPSADRDALLEAATKLGSLVHTASSASQPIGWMARQDWEESKRILVNYLDMSETVSTDSLYTNSFLPDRKK